MKRKSETSNMDTTTETTETHETTELHRTAPGGNPQVQKSSIQCLTEAAELAREHYAFAQRCQREAQKYVDDFQAKHTPGAQVPLDMRLAVIEAQILVYECQDAMRAAERDLAVGLDEHDAAPILDKLRAKLEAGQARIDELKGQIADIERDLDAVTGEAAAEYAAVQQARLAAGLPLSSRRAPKPKMRSDSLWDAQKRLWRATGRRPTGAEVQAEIERSRSESYCWSEALRDLQAASAPPTTNANLIAPLRHEARQIALAIAEQEAREAERREQEARHDAAKKAKDATAAEQIRARHERQVKEYQARQAAADAVLDRA